MPTYFWLINYTQQGIERAREIPGHLEKVRDALAKAGAELRSFHLTTSRFDGIALIEAPDDLTIAHLSLLAETFGNARTEILRAYDEKEIGTIVAGLPGRLEGAVLRQL